jgi:L-iditol 2-dehydrogenase
MSGTSRRGSRALTGNEREPNPEPDPEPDPERDGNPEPNPEPGPGPSRSPSPVTRMLQAELLAPGHLEMRDVPVPSPGPGELLVRVEAALTCGTDVKMFRRGHPRIPLPAPFGHEFSGRVAAAGDGVRRFSEGDPVACVPSAPCGECRLCRRGRENLCALAIDRIVLGAYAEYVLLPAHIVRAHVFARPPGLSAEVAAALEPLSCTVHGASRVALERAESVVLLGDGPIAMLFVQVALQRGAERVLVAGRHRARLDAARSLGALTMEATGDALREQVRDHTAGHGADLVIECVGTPETWELAQTLVAAGGEVLLFGGCAAGTRACFDTLPLHYEEADLKGAFHYRPADVRDALELLSSGAVDITTLISHRVPLAALDAALSMVIERRAIKVAVLP